MSKGDLDLGGATPGTGFKQWLSSFQAELGRSRGAHPARARSHTQEHSPRHGDDGDEVSLAVVGHKPDAGEAFQLSKRLQDDLAAGLVWGGDAIA